MLIEKPRCNFKNCRYCFDGNCYSAAKYENCKVTDLHCEIAKLTVDLDNAKAEVAREIFKEIDKALDKARRKYRDLLDANGVIYTNYARAIIAELKKKYTEGDK